MDSSERWVSSERSALWNAQSLANGENSTIAAELDSQTRGLAGLWAGLIGFFSIVMTFAIHDLSILVGGLLLAATIYGLVRLAGLSRSVRSATCRQKFIARKKRREFVVLGDRSFRVSRSIYDRMNVGSKYRIHTSAPGTAVFDLVELSRPEVEADRVALDVRAS